jgi:hypothetical protein
MTKIIRAFTGPTVLTENQVEFIEAAILDLDGYPDEVRTGCAYGVDTIAANVQWFEFPHARHKFYVPAAGYNERLVEWFEPHGNTEIIRCPSRESQTNAYRRRNEMMVHGATELIAFIHQPKFYRSGEWMTINIAKKANVFVYSFVLPPREEDEDQDGAS